MVYVFLVFFVGPQLVPVDAWKCAAYDCVCVFDFGWFEFIRPVAGGNMVRGVFTCFGLPEFEARGFAVEGFADLLGPFLAGGVAVGYRDDMCANKWRHIHLVEVFGAHRRRGCH
jgi:hypothetical protein